MTTTVKGRFAAPLRRLLASRGWTAYELAKRAGLQRPVVYRLLRGEADPNYRTMVALAEALGCRLRDFEEAKNGRERQA